MTVRTPVRISLVAAVLAVLPLAQAPGQQPDEAKLPLPVLDQKLKSELVSYVQRHFSSPEQYVLSKFKDNQIVFIGEYHRIKHDVQLIHRLIPLLYEAGITNLGIEFGIHRDQDRVDKLIRAPTYDEQAARDMVFNFGSYWAFQDYMDIYRAAWEVNHKLPPGAPRFRVVNLNAYVDWSHVKTPADRDDPEVMKRTFPDGDSDKFMADVIIREFVETGQRALIYSGIHHAFTRYKQPICNQGKFMRFVDNRMGNRVYEKLGEKVFTIYLHAPWSDKDYRGELYPAGGMIDALFADQPTLRPVGFDLTGSPFGELAGPGSSYEEGYRPFALKLYADGYIYTTPLSQYQGVTVDDEFVTEANFKRAVEQIPNPEYRSRVTSVSQLLQAARNDANIAHRFRQFQ